MDPLGLAKNIPTGTPNQARAQVLRGQAPGEITRIDRPNSSVPDSQFHATCACGSALNINGSIKDDFKGPLSFSKKTLEWLKRFGWEVPK